MNEAPNNEVARQQKQIEQEMNAEALKNPNQKSPTFKVEYRQLFFDEVNRRQQELKDLGIQLNHPSVDSFINDAQDKMASSLRGIAEVGRAVLKEKKVLNSPHQKPEIKNEDAIAIDRLAADLKIGLAQITEDTDKFQKIKAAENDFDEAEANEKVLQAQGTVDIQDATQQKQIILNGFLEAKNKLLHPELRTQFTNEYYDQLNEKVNMKLEETYLGLKELQLKNNPLAYYVMVETDFVKRLHERVQDPDIINGIWKNFAEKADPLRQKLFTNNQDEREKVAEELDELSETLLDEIPADTITIESQGRVFECRFDPKIPASEYQEKLRDAQETVQTYLKCLDLKELRLSDWNETFTFINGSLKTRLDYNGTNKKDKERGRYYEFFVTSNDIEFKDSSPVAEEKMEKMKLFKAAFEAWQKTPASELGFTYGDPPVYIDMAKYLGREGKNKQIDKEIDKDDISFNFFFQEGVPEFLEIAKYGKNEGLVSNEIRHYYFDHEERGKHLKMQKIFTHYVGAPDDLYQETREYYKPSEVGDKLVAKKITTQNSSIIINQDYDRDEKIVRREAFIPGFTDIRSVYYVDGKPIYNENGTLKTRAVLEWQEGNEKKTFHSFAEMKEKNPAMTEDQYIGYMAQNLTTDVLKNAWLNLMYQYTHDTPDSKDPLKKGTPENSGDYWQSPEETVRRTENGLSLGDCEDAAFLMKEILHRQGIDAYTLFVPHHAVTMSLHQAPDGSYYLKGYGVEGVFINGKKLRDADPNEKYSTPEAALKSYQSLSKEIGLPKRIFGMLPYESDQHKVRELVAVIHRIKEGQDPWENTPKEGKFTEYAQNWGKAEILYFPQELLKTAGIESNGEYVVADRHAPGHQKGDHYYILNTSPDWFRVNQDYEQLKTRAMAVSENRRNKEEIRAYVTLFSSVQSGELYKLDADELNRRWPGGQWRGGFRIENKDQDVKTIADKLRSFL